MSLSLKKAFVVFVMILSLLAGLFGWSIRMHSFPGMQYHTSIQATQLLADGPNYVCPPPPSRC